MAKFLHWLKSYPMRVVDPRYFVDRVTGKDVRLCKDRHGRYWMADGQWDVSRVACFASETSDA